MESWFALLQKNVLDRRTWDTKVDLRIAIVTWIERTYHRRRRQARLGRLTPIEYETIMTTTAIRPRDYPCHLSVQQSRPMSLPAYDPAPLAVSYLRVSTRDQATRGGLAEGLSLPAQRAAIRMKADAMGATIVKEFADAGESGRTADRPQLQEMLQYLRDHRVDVVYVHKIDRLARDRASDVQINLAIRQTGARLVSIPGNVDETPQGQLVHGIFSAVADFYSQNLAQEVAKGMEQRVRTGGTLGRAPLGYENIRTFVNGAEARQVAIDPVRADHVRWAFETYANDPDMTLRRLTELLEARGLTVKATPSSLNGHSSAAMSTACS